MKLNLPKKYLSWSAINLWNINKEQFRDRYYRNIKFPDTVYTLFGKEVHKALETEKFKDVPRYSHSEYKIEVLIEDIPILGYIDSFEESTHTLLDYKTGSMKADGSPRWTQSDVEKHDQLPFYALLVKEKFGSVDKNCKLVWLVTRNKKKTDDFAGLSLEGDSTELELTGDVFTFNRKIAKWEHDRIREIIVQSAKDISQDYTEFARTLTPQR